MSKSEAEPRDVREDPLSARLAEESFGVAPGGQPEPAPAVEVPDRDAAPTHGESASDGPAMSKAGTRRREEILDGAALMFAQHGYYGASLREISRQVGMSHPGMLHHFESKDALLDGVIDRLEEHAQEALDRVDELCVDPQALLRSFAKTWHPGSPSIQLLSMLNTDALSAEHPGWYRMARLRRVHEHILERCFEKFAERHLLREDLDPAFASRAMLDLVLGHAVREKTVRILQSEPHDDSPMSDIAKLLRALLSGPSTEAEKT